METLELSENLVTLTDDESDSDSMQRAARSMGRGQQPEPTSRDVASEEQQDAVTVGRTSRNNSKLKVLVRSHAMRESTSPPREPTSTSTPVLTSTPPCINLIPSPSPAPNDNTVSATTIVVCSAPSDAEALTSALTRNLNGAHMPPQDAVVADPDDSNPNSSPLVSNGNGKGEGTQRLHLVCECTKCGKTNERNINNNDCAANNNNNNGCTLLTVGRPNSLKHKLRQHSSSSLGSVEDGSSNASPCLSRDSSAEQYTDTTGVDLTHFIMETLNKNAKDRIMLLKIEQELVNLAKDKIKTHFKFPPMSSYQRMLVHRCAAYFGMDHNIEISGKCVVVNKTKNTRVPEVRFRDHIRGDLLFPEEPRRSILKRDSNSFEDCAYKSPDRQYENRRSKSFEEREEEYEKVRRRIFKDGSEEFSWTDMPWPESECSKIRLLPPEHCTKQNRLLKVQSVDNKSDQTLRPCVAKSYSFGGYGDSASVLARGDSITSTHSAGPRLFTKQDSATSTGTISWRLSPSSSGYKSQRSDSVTPSPTTTPHQLSDASGKYYLEGADSIRNYITEEMVEQAQQTDDRETSLVVRSSTICVTAAAHMGSGDTNQLIWAVTDMHSIPKGSILIDPQTGEPFTNDDGTLYHFDLSNPPPGCSSFLKLPPSTSTTKSSSISSERSSSPKKIQKKPLSLRQYNNKSCLTNSSTSPSLPASSSPVSNQHFTESLFENLPGQPFQVYPNIGFGHGNMTPNNDGHIQMFQPQTMGMVYTPYGTPAPYDNRTDSALTDLPGYFLNMSMSEQPPSNNPPVGFQTYWGQQPMTYYQVPPNAQQPPLQQQPPQQRYPVQVPALPAPAPGPNFPPNPYIPVASPDMLPFLSNPPQMMYGPPNPTPNQMFIQNPMMYTQNSAYNPGLYPPPANSLAGYPPPSTPTPGANMPPQCYNQPPVNYKGVALANKNHLHIAAQTQRRLTYPIQPTQTSSSYSSSGGTNSPATVIASGSVPPFNYRQCTPPETPPALNGAIGGMGTFGPPPMMFRQLPAPMRASPPGNLNINMRSSRSPTPASSEYVLHQQQPMGAPNERSQRYPIPPAFYPNMPCLLPCDMRLMTNRPQPTTYRQSYRPQNFQAVPENNSASRPYRFRKTRNKVPVSPSSRQSSQTIQAHTQQRH